MNVDQLTQLIPTLGPTAGVLIWLIFGSRRAEPAENPASSLLRELVEIRERLAAVEAILDERKGK